LKTNRNVRLIKIESIIDKEGLNVYKDSVSILKHMKDLALNSNELSVKEKEYNTRRKQREYIFR